MMESQTFLLESRAERVTEDLFALTNPWRDRFLAFVAERALGRDWDGQLPTKNEVTRWLTRKNLCYAMTLLLDRWQAGTDIVADLS
jgi:hypothetical protein